MKLLIVDDEIYVIKAILESVNWEALKFDEILTATRYSQAINILSNNEIAVMLCDVEMPMGSGLDLMEWMKEHSPDTQNIILSCHDEFYFVKQALSLQCMEYLLKPTEPDVLLEVLGRAKQKWLENKEQQRYMEYGKRYISQAEESTSEETEDSKDAVTMTEIYIRDHINDNLSVEQLAGRVNLNSEHLSRLFKKKHGRTLNEYIAAERMKLAGDMLRDTQMTVSMVASRVGYPNYSYFTRAFKKHYDMTPREYQQMCKRKKSDL